MPPLRLIRVPDVSSAGGTAPADIPKHPTGKDTTIGTKRINSCILQSHKVETYMMGGQMACSSEACLSICVAGWDHVRPLSAVSLSILSAKDNCNELVDEMNRTRQLERLKHSFLRHRTNSLRKSLAFKYRLLSPSMLCRRPNRNDLAIFHLMTTKKTSASRVFVGTAMAC